MAALSVTNPTLLDLSKSLDPDGTFATVVELLMQTNDILDDMSWMEGNLLTGHQFTMRSGLPTPTWRKLNAGVQPTKSTKVQATANTGMLEDYSEVDKAAAELNGYSASWRLSEDKAHIEGMNQELADTLFNGDEGSEPEAFTGLVPFYNSLSAESADNIINEGDASNLRSIWLVCWSPETIFGVVPKGSKAGIQVRDLGEDTKVDSNGAMHQVLRTHYRWDAGLCVADWRYAVRICNIDSAALVKDASSGPDLPDLMYQAMELIPNMSMGRCAFYMDRETRSFARRQITNATKSSTLTIENVGGKMVEYFHGVPLRRCDALAADETAVA